MKFYELKKFWRCKSWAFVQHGRPDHNPDKLQKYQWKGNDIYYRPSTSDVGVIYDILIHKSRPLHPNRTFFRSKQPEYWVPLAVDPAVILDIGGNIGTTSVYYANLFPEATIHTFEPVEDNYSILKKNISPYNNITAYNVGLGTEDGSVDIYQCNEEGNAGGFSLYDLDVDESKKQTISLRKADKFLHENNILQPDLIKIDTEGAEYDILSTLDPKMLSNVKWIIGELHGNKDFELLAYLSQWFDIDIQKNLNKRLSLFNARN